MEAGLSPRLVRLPVTTALLNGGPQRYQHSVTIPSSESVTPYRDRSVWPPVSTEGVSGEMPILPEDRVVVADLRIGLGALEFASG